MLLGHGGVTFGLFRGVGPYGLAGIGHGGVTLRGGLFREVEIAGMGAVGTWWSDLNVNEMIN